MEERRERKLGEVCVTGGNGYIASNLIKRLLQEGYTVRATVRNPDDPKNSILRDLPGAKQRLSVVSANLLEDGSFDTVIEGVEGVFHTAAPVLPDRTKSDPKGAMVDACLKGTLNVLRACAKSTTVKKIVMTSSCSAIRYGYYKPEDNNVLDESNWSDLDYCENHKMWYAFSKTIGEKKAWEFSQQHNLNLIVVNPSVVLGPFLGSFPSSTMLYALYIFQGKLPIPNQVVGFVHIDDVVATHLLLYEEEKSKGRYICSSTVTLWEKLVELLHEKYPSLSELERCTDEKSNAIHGSGENINHTMNTNKLKKLGIQFKSLEKILDDSVKCLKEKSLLPQSLVL